MPQDPEAYADPRLKAPALQLHAQDLLSHMLYAAGAVTGGPDRERLQAYIQVELRRLAEFLTLLERQRWEEHMDEDEARLWAHIAVNHADKALSGLEVYGLQGAPEVVGAAIAAVRGQVNRAVGFVVV